MFHPKGLLRCREKAATQDDTNFVISIYEEIMMSHWTCSMYFDEIPSCLFHDSHPQGTRVDQESQFPEKSDNASKPKRKRKKKRRRGDISVKDKQATFKSIIDSFSLCKLLHESDYRKCLPFVESSCLSKHGKFYRVYQPCR